MKGGKVADSQSTPKQGETSSGRDRASRPKKSEPSPSAQSGVWEPQKQERGQNRPIALRAVRSSRRFYKITLLA
jgi:hypothetical protein